MANNLTGAGATMEEEKTPVLEAPQEQFNPFDIKNIAQAEQKAGEEALLAEKAVMEEQPVQEIVEEAPEIKQEPIKTEPVKVEKPTVTPKGDKVADAQVIKSTQLANKATEENIQTQQSQKTLTEFSTALKSGNLEGIAKIASNNPALREDFNSMIKNNLKSEEGIAYFRKYSGMTNEQLQTAVDNGEIVIGSDKFNTLPEEQRNSFLAYNKTYEASKSGDKNYNKDKFQKDNTNIISTEKEESTIASYQSLDLRKKYTELLNSPEIKDSSKKLTNLQDEVNDYNDQLDRIEDDVKEEYPNLPKSAQAALIAQRQKSILRAKNTKINEYNSELGNYTRLKDNVNLELEFAKYEDAQNQARYKAELTAYTAERERLTDIAKAEFEAQNKIKAEEVKHQRSLELKAFEASLKETDPKGVYKTSRDGKLLYVVNGQATEVTEAAGEIVFTEDNTEKEFKDTTYSKDGVYTTVRTYENGDRPDYFTHDITGNSVSSMSVYDNLAKIPSTGLQCGQAANKYVTGLGVPSSEFWVGDSYESKAKYIDSSIITPEPGMLAIWNPGSVDGVGGTDYGHIAIVSGPVQEDGTVEITDWNMDGEGKKNTRMVKVSTIKQSEGGFYNPIVKKPEVVGYESSMSPLFKKYGEGKFSGTDWSNLTIEKEQFLGQFENYKKDISKDGEQNVARLYDIANKLKTGDGRVLASLGIVVPRTDAADYKALFDEFTAVKTLDNLISVKAQGATFGALSEKELQFLKDSATGLDLGMSDKLFQEKIDKIITTLEKGLPEGFLEEEVVEETPKSNGYEAYKERRKRYDYTKY